MIASSSRLSQIWIRFLSDRLNRLHDHAFDPPLFISGDDIRTSGYLEHFPHQLFAANVSGGATDLYVTPAACLHVYAELADKEVQRHAALGTAHCARYEGGSWQHPYRRPDFHMLELVTLGDHETVEKTIREATLLLTSMFAELGMTGHFQPATDAFFLGEDDGAKRMQQLKNLKQEFTVNAEGQEIALCSINYHEDYFGTRFRIRNGQAFAHSCCVAFGIERLAAYSLACWGSDSREWPQAFASYVALP